MEKENKVFIKIDGEVTEYEATSEMRNKVTALGMKNGIKNAHLCWCDCANAYACKCLKIFDRRKRNIADYDFIRSGAEIFDKNGELDTLLVLNCDNYEIEEKRETGDLAKKRENLRKSYYGTSTIEEANIMQYEIVERNLAYVRKERAINGVKISEESIMPKGRMINETQYKTLKLKKND